MGQVGRWGLVVGRLSARPFGVLQDWSVRTENPYEANMFFIPAMAYFYTENIHSPVTHLLRVIRHVSTEYPYWNRTGVSIRLQSRMIASALTKCLHPVGGKDHFFWMPGDKGACHIPTSLMESTIKVRGPPMLLRCLCHGRGYWIRDSSLFRPRRSDVQIVHFGLSSTYPAQSCFNPQRDIVAPPVAVSIFLRTRKSTDLFAAIAANGGRDGQERDKFLFFAGDVRREDLQYSGGARQALYNALHNTSHNISDVVFAEGKLSR